MEEENAWCINLNHVGLPINVKVLKSNSYMITIWFVTTNLKAM